MASVAELRWLVAVLCVACAEDDLAGSLAQGQCGPEQDCAVGYECSSQNECVPLSDAGPDSACGTCPLGFICCNTACVDKNADPAHCGSCSIACPGTICQAGSCTNDCQPGLANCNLNVFDGCEAPATSCPPDAG